MIITEIRIVLDTPDNQPLYWAYYDETEDYADKPLPSDVALNLIRHGMAFIIALKDPDDKHSHYQSDLTSCYRV